MTKEEFKNMVQNKINERLKNSVCVYCGNDARLFVGDGTKIDIIEASAKKIYEDIMVSVVCSNCGYVSSFLPKFLFGEMEQDFLNFFIANFENNEAQKSSQDVSEEEKNSVEEE